MKKGLKGEVSLMNRGKGRGLKAKPPVLFLPPNAEQGRGGKGSPAAARSAAQGTDVASGLGEKKV